WRLRFGLEEDFDLDGGVAREGVDADGGAGVLAGVAEDLLQQLAGGVGDLGLVGKGRVAADESAEAYHAGDRVNSAGNRLHGGDSIDDALPRRGPGVF